MRRSTTSSPGRGGSPPAELQQWLCPLALRRAVERSPVARRHGSAQFNDVFAISKIAVCRAPPVARRHGSARLNEARWHRLCHFKLDLDGLITEDGIASTMLFQVRSGWLDHRGRDQREDFAPTHSSGRDSLDYSIFMFYPDGLISEAEFNQDVGLIAPITVLDALASTTPFPSFIWMACSSRPSSTRTSGRCVHILQR